LAQLKITGQGNWVKYPDDFLWMTPKSQAALFPAAPEPLENWPLPFVLRFLVQVESTGKVLTKFQPSNFGVSILTPNGMKACEILQLDLSGWLGVAVRLLVISLPPNPAELSKGPNMLSLTVKYSKLQGTETFVIKD
jgi:hypothetical protein